MTTRFGSMAPGWLRLTALALLGFAAVAQAQTPINLQRSPTLLKIRDAGVITLAHRESSIPFSYLDAQKRPVGYSIDQ